MREIKFRGKHIHAFIEPHNTGIWVYGYLCNDHYINSEELMGEMLVDKDTVGQWTGLKDKNGKEIYEGDIVKIDCPTMKMQGKIFYYEDGADFRIYDDIEDIEETLWYLQEEYEVIGNIYDNPELLEKGEIKC